MLSTIPILKSVRRSPILIYVWHHLVIFQDDVFNVDLFIIKSRSLLYTEPLWWQWVFVWSSNVKDYVLRKAALSMSDISLCLLVGIFLIYCNNHNTLGNLHPSLHIKHYLQMSNIRRTKFQSLNASRLVLQLCLCYTLKPGSRPTKDKCHDILQISWH